MTLIEWLIQPLLKAQYQKGVEEGIQKSLDQAIAEGFKIGEQRSHEAYQEWIRRQIEAGTQFREDIPPPQP